MIYIPQYKLNGLLQYKQVLESHAAQTGKPHSVISPTQPVPNPYVILQRLTPNHKIFTAIDLASAFSQYLSTLNTSSMWPSPIEDNNFDMPDSPNDWKSPLICTMQPSKKTWKVYPCQKMCYCHTMLTMYWLLPYQTKTASQPREHSYTSRVRLQSHIAQNPTVPTDGHVSGENNISTKHRYCRTSKTSNPGVLATKASERHAQLPWIMRLQPCLCTELCEPHSSPGRHSD